MSNMTLSQRSKRLVAALGLATVLGAGAGLAIAHSAPSHAAPVTHGQHHGTDNNRPDVPGQPDVPEPGDVPD